MRRLKLHLLSAFVFLTVGALLGAQLDVFVGADDGLEQFEKMKRAFVLISGKYVEQVSPKRLAVGGVEGMLNRLDPHSSYIPSEQVRRTRARIRGSFGGIGIRLDVLNDTARVLSTIEEGPSKQAGVKPGDRIVEIQGGSVVGTPLGDIRHQLTGGIGTTVTFTVYRPLSNKRLTFTIEREEIPLYSINSSYMLENQTGYVKIDRFSQSTHDEFVKVVGALKKRGMQRLVLDLRQNSGGVMESAIQIADEMLGQPGMLIVEMKGRSSAQDQRWRTQAGGVLDNQPVTVLVDGNTASASEILAGALQDYDRALLVGRRTYGKGLVQKQFTLNDGSLLKLSVAGYYTPVGRSIQTPYKKGHRAEYHKKKIANKQKAVYNVQEYKERIPDSLSYRTQHGRVVFGGGGILPDHIIRPDTTSLTGFLRHKGKDRLFEFYVGEWFAKHEKNLRSVWQNREDEFLSSYSVPPKAISNFWEFVQNENLLTLTSDAERVDPSKRIYPQNATEEATPLVQAHIKSQLADLLYGPGTGQPLLNEVDPILQKATMLWPSSQELASYHSSVSQNE